MMSQSGDSRNHTTAVEAFDLSGRVAIVTGGGTGIGAACADLFARHGADVVIASRNLVRLESVAADLRAATSRSVVAIGVNVKDEEGCVRLVAEVFDRFGRIDILVNNAGGAFFGPLVDMPTKAWDAVAQLNVRAPFILTREVARHMIVRRTGVIVNIGSGAGVRGTMGGSHYSAAKAGLHQLTRVTAAELGPYGIRCNCVSPSAPIMSELVLDAMASGNMNPDAMGAEVPLRRLGEPVELAWGVLFFASDAASYISGQILEVDGGPATLYGSLKMPGGPL